MIQNTTELFINDQQLLPISRNDNIVQASRLAVVKSRKTGVLNHLNGNHKSKSLVRNAPEILPPSHLSDILTSPNNYKQHAPLARYYNNIVQASRLAAEQLRKTGVIIHLQGNKESESLIRNAPALFLDLPTTSRYPGRIRGESLIRNVSQQYTPGINAELIK